ncbi:hypothetical protein [Rugamonas sp.]|uniref:hypothetical protein n=1 Tax=Rugamonas sp. TaxID=1926287 RepID=UPI0025EAB7C3|nr:hypothetical protein [Rugamonas sp.]
MDILNTGGDSDSVLDLNVLAPQKPDISAGLLQVQESLRGWKKLMANGQVEALVVKIDAPPETAGVAARMLSEQEQQQLRMSKEEQSNYLQAILQTPIF